MDTHNVALFRISRIRAILKQTKKETVYIMRLFQKRGYSCYTILLYHNYFFISLTTLFAQTRINNCF